MRKIIYNTNEITFNSFLRETWVDESRSSVGEGGDLLVERLGSRYFAEITFTPLNRIDIIKFEPLLDITLGDSFVFYPEADGGAYIECVLTPNSIIRLRQAPFHQSIRLFELKMESVKRVSGLKYAGDIPISEGYGYNYGYDYGVGL